MLNIIIKNRVSNHSQRTLSSSRSFLQCVKFRYIFMKHVFQNTQADQSLSNSQHLRSTLHYGIKALPNYCHLKQKQIWARVRMLEQVLGESGCKFPLRLTRWLWDSHNNPSAPSASQGCCEKRSLLSLLEWDNKCFFSLPSPSNCVRYFRGSLDAEK